MVVLLFCKENYQWFSYFAGKIINGTLEFWHFINNSRKFFFIINGSLFERFYVLCFKLKNKRKRKKLTVLDDFERKKLKKSYDCKTLNYTRLSLIIDLIKKIKNIINKVPKLRIPLIITLFFNNSNETFKN